MPQERELTRQRLADLWECEEVPLLPSTTPYAIMSDFHLGNGRSADDFSHNEPTLAAALDHYHAHGFALILLGDIEELWQFRPEDILARYGDSIYSRLRAFGPARIHRVFGNHDLAWASSPDPLWPGRATPSPEAVKLADSTGVARMLLVHGHQGSTESDRFGSLSRPVVRVFRVLEPLARALGLYRNPVTARSQITTSYEKIMHGWARDAGVVLVCGHSHRAVFASQSYADRLRRALAALEAEASAREDDTREARNESIRRLRRALREEIHKGRDMEPTDDGIPLPCYFNCGCGLYTDGLTALEVADGELRLVKWHRDPHAASRRKVYQRCSLEEVFARVAPSPTTLA